MRDHSCCSLIGQLIYRCRSMTMYGLNSTSHLVDFHRERCSWRLELPNVLARVRVSDTTNYCVYHLLLCLSCTLVVSFWSRLRKHIRRVQLHERLLDLLWVVVDMLLAIARCWPCSLVTGVGRVRMIWGWYSECLCSLVLLARRLFILLHLLLLVLIKRLLDGIWLWDCLVDCVFHFRRSLHTMLALHLIGLVEYLIKCSEHLLMDKLLIHTALRSVSIAHLTRTVAFMVILLRTNWHRLVTPFLRFFSISYLVL